MRTFGAYFVKKLMYLLPNIQSGTAIMSHTAFVQTPDVTIVAPSVCDKENNALIYCYYNIDWIFIGYLQGLTLTVLFSGHCGKSFSNVKSLSMLFYEFVMMFLLKFSIKSLLLV